MITDYYIMAFGTIRCPWPCRLPQQVEQAIEKKKHTFLLGNQVAYMRIFAGSSLFLKIVVPVMGTDSMDIIGSLHGLIMPKWIQEYALEQELGSIISNTPPGKKHS